MSILLTGGSGQLGFELQRSLAPLATIVAPTRADCDLADPDGLRALVRAVRPHLIVNPAAYTAVDRAEGEAALAHAVNGVAPGVLAEEAARLGIPLIHYSTDYVFSGEQAGCYGEDDAPDPRSVYGASKLAGEQAVQAATPDHLIFRTSWVFGAHGGNFAKTMLRLAGERDRLRVVADQFGAPTSAALIADVTAQILGRLLREGRTGFPFGLYHLVAGGETSWYDYARTVIGAAQAAGRPLRLGVADIEPIASADYPTPATRPANSRLATERLRRTFGLHLPPWQDGLRHVLEQIL